MITPIPFNRFITGSLVCLILLGGLGLNAVQAQSVSQTRLTPADGRQFGCALASSGSSLVVGDAFWNSAAHGTTGAAYVYTLSSGQWTPVTKLTAPDGLFGDGFGTALALSGNQIAVGAPGHNSGSGAVYPYTYSASGWMPQAELTTDIALTNNDQLGAALALSGSTLMVGAPGHNSSTGAILVYALNGGAWTLTSGMYVGYGQPYDVFGSAVALSGSLLAIGAPNANYATGSLYTN